MKMSVEHALQNDSCGQKFLEFLEELRLELGVLSNVVPASDPNKDPTCIAVTYDRREVFRYQFDRDSRGKGKVFLDFSFAKINLKKQKHVPKRFGAI
jgi:hypothetical protein